MVPICSITGTFVDLTATPISGATIDTTISGYINSGTAIITSSVFLDDYLISHYSMQYTTKSDGTFLLTLPQNAVVDVLIDQASYHKRVIIPTSTSADMSSLQVIEDLW